MHPPQLSSRKVVVVGAGPVGCLCALALARRGWSVEIFEGRADMRIPAVKAAVKQRSINLAISHRGIAALEAIDPAAAQRFLQDAIPMHGRMIHKLSGDLDSQLYDRDGQCINSIDRALLNEGLLDEVDSSINTRVFFNHKVIAADFDTQKMLVRDSASNKEFSIDFDFCVGADGSYSIIRRQLMRVVRMNYQQEYIKDEYVELKMPAGRDANGEPTFLLDEHHLHIWPRRSFMLIALPNKDKTFTCTLFAPSVELDRLHTPDETLAWFSRYFPDAVRLIGDKTLVNDFLKNPRCPLICTKANPYHYKDRAIILGDAAHSMVPFYGQGLNAGLEDVRVLATILDQEAVSAAPTSDGHDRRLANALQRYSETRHKDLIAITELAMDNYIEMRHKVTQGSYIVQKFLDNVLYSLTSSNMLSLASLTPTLSQRPYPSGRPRGWLPLYTMVTFRPDINYATVKQKAARQSTILSMLLWFGIGALGAAAAWLMWATGNILVNYLHK
ncbi:FAD/NAD-binding domain-containing protein [Crepidotus variabilis]|uniref:Kynurenine 3-monooxygenase n=1 Tax=Crepidotus variabilis TaxID=179855 RepID=A0A9P6JTT9_9AGAR|nr:FAD/NAD-binding domain-containing protein [Crepidotus variabilis]